MSKQRVADLNSIFIGKTHYLDSDPMTKTKRLRSFSIDFLDFQHHSSTCYCLGSISYMEAGLEIMLLIWLHFAVTEHVWSMYIYCLHTNCRHPYLICCRVLANALCQLIVPLYVSGINMEHKWSVKLSYSRYKSYLCQWSKFPPYLKN